MGRERTNPVREFFVYDRESNTSRCQIEGCNFDMKGDHAANLERHIQRIHPDIYESHMLSKPRSSKRQQDATGCPSNKRSASQQSLEEVIRRKATKSAVSKASIVSACVELVTTNGRPFQLMEDSGFRNLLNPLIEIAGGGFAINSKNIRTEVREVAAKTRQHISESLRSRLFSLKIDCATRMDRAVLGINAQYIENGKIVVQTLAMKELYERHTAQYITLQVQDVLARYELGVNQVYSLTTDNGSNMLKAASLLNDESSRAAGDYDDASTSDDISMDIDEEFCLTGEHQDVRQIHSIRCAAHTLQLAVNDALKHGMTIDIFAKCRNISKKLRTQTLMSLIRKLKLKKPILDCVTRWMSTVIMLRRLTELRGFCDDMFGTDNELRLQDDEWKAVDDAIEALAPAEEATKRLQTEQLTLGDFYSLWIACRERTAKLTSALASSLAASMRSRETRLFEGELFCSAIFLDVRYHVLLSDDQRTKAKLHLTRLWKRLAPPSARSRSAPSETTSSEEHAGEITDEVEELLRQKDRVRPTATPIHSISSMLEATEAKPRINKHVDILKYWECQTEKEPEMKALADVVLAVPATQVSVERAFSALKYILSDQRASLAPDILEDILVVRSARSASTPAYSVCS
ncbi:uncharacterized protein LOC135387057 [Ornithodoros turicata]|uniref:uncharacterized protein LOC135387057 n=1 Tax=Ornithodoros turicata TaxID=34597 RepID=UPI003139CC08